MTFVERIELFEVAIPLRSPHVTSSGVTAERRVILMAITAEGITGWGECAPVPGYSEATIEQCWSALTRVGHAITTREDSALTTPTYASAALDQALEDRAARAAQTPLWRHVGGARDRVAAGAVVGLAPPEEVLASAEEAVAAGYRHVKVKIAPGRDIEALTSVRRRLPALSLAADANGSYRKRNRGELVPLDDLGLAYLEQPYSVGFLADHVALARDMATPICLDESTEEAGWPEAASGLAATVKTARMGWRRIRELLASPGMGDRVRLRVGGMLETGVGRAHALAAATRDDFTLPSDLSPPSSYLQADVVAPSWALEGGEIRLPDGPGIGVEVDREQLAAVTVRRAAFP